MAIFLAVTTFDPGQTYADTERLPVWARLCRPLPDGDRPIPLRGKLAVTFIDPDIPKSEGDQHEVGIYDLAQRGLRRLTRNRYNEAEVEATQTPSVDERSRGASLRCRHSLTIRPSTDRIERYQTCFPRVLPSAMEARQRRGQPMSSTRRQCQMS